jgi:hypothetical protein
MGRHWSPLPARSTLRPPCGLTPRDDQHHGFSFLQQKPVPSGTIPLDDTVDLSKVLPEKQVNINSEVRMGTRLSPPAAHLTRGHIFRICLVCLFFIATGIILTTLTNQLVVWSSSDAYCAMICHSITWATGVPTTRIKWSSCQLRRLSHSVRCWPRNGVGYVRLLLVKRSQGYLGKAQARAASDF